MASIEVQLNPDVKPSGSDLAVVNAARRSFNKRSERDANGELKRKDKRLLQFLARGMTADDFEEFCSDIAHEGEYEYNGGRKDGLVELLWQWRNTPTHDTPFNHCFISFEVKAPVFVARQLVKHEYLIMSEFSRRYITDDIEFYEPDYWRKAAPNKKQGSLEESVKPYQGSYTFGEGKDTFIRSAGWLAGDHKKGIQLLAVQTFRALLAEGVAPEQARMVLPQSTMTEWTWSGTLGAFAKMCKLRLHPEAQYESRLVAQEVYKHLKAQWPVSAPALVEGVL